MAESKQPGLGLSHEQVLAFAEDELDQILNQAHRSVHASEEKPIPGLFLKSISLDHLADQCTEA